MMAAVIAEWQFIEAKRTALQPAQGGKACSREEEFRAALDRYMASYAEHQRRRAEMIERARCGARARFTAWLRDRVVILFPQASRS
jgi:hypothetical protein